MNARRIAQGIIVIAVLVVSPLAGAGADAPDGRGNAGKGDAASHWTAARRAAAQPRDLVIDEHGLGYLRRADGTLVPHGHAVPAAKPGGGGTSDTTGPAVGTTDPDAGATIGASHTFSAIVTDEGSGVKAVTFQLTKDSGSTSSFSASKGAGDVWSVGLQGFTDGTWSWTIVAKDNATRGGNTSISDPITFTVDTGAGGGTDPVDPDPGTGTVVVSEAWTTTGDLQTAAGRIYFEMPANRQQTRWSGYVCSGTVATDDTTGRSIILTAAHCVYDDVYKTFAQNVLFIPDQDRTGTATDRDCSNDVLGCWTPSFGVVDTDWTTRKFPANIPWDYAYYVVQDPGHSGAGAGGALDVAAKSLDIQFSAPTLGDYTHALGYSYSEDPNFMYCAEDLATESSYGDWWLGSCGLSGGSSGGPWVQPMGTDGTGPIISVNSWGYTNSPGMAGPRLSGTSASCLFGVAKTGSFSTTATSRGVASDCQP